MLSAALITFRETLEIVLVLGVVLAYLGTTHHPRYRRYAYAGFGAAVVGSALFAWLFLALQGSFEGVSEMVFEGTTMILAAALIAVMVFWMLRHRHYRQEIERELSEDVARKDRIGIFLIVFASVLREGVETVIFLSAAVSDPYDTLIGALLGIALAAALGYTLFVLLKRVDLKRLFAITSVLLVLFGAGLVSRGVGEFHEAGVLPVIVAPVYDITPDQNADGSYPITHEGSALGGLLKDLFGYTTAPSLLQVIGYIGYLLAVFLVWRSVDRKHADAL